MALWEFQEFKKYLEKYISFHSFDPQKFIPAYYIPGTALNTGDIAVN